MRNNIKIGLFLLLLGSNAFGDIAIINKWSVNIREKPSLDSRILGYAKMGDIFNIVDKKKSNKKWSQISTGGYLSNVVFKRTTVIEPFFLKGMLFSGANIRTNVYIGKTNNIVRRLKKGEKVEAIVLLNNGWYLLKDKTFVNSTDVILVESTSNSIISSQVKQNIKLNVVPKRKNIELECVV